MRAPEVVARAEWDRVLPHTGLVMSLAVGIAKRWPLRYLSTDDLFQAGLLAAARALPQHDVARGAESTWVGTNARYAMLDLVKSATPLRISKWSFDHRAPGFEQAAAATVGLDRAHDVAERVATDPTCPAVWREERAVLRAAISKLPVRLRRVIRGRFFEGLTLHALGVELGVTRERVRQLEVKAMDRIARNMARRRTAVSA